MRNMGPYICLRKQGLNVNDHYNFTGAHSLKFSLRYYMWTIFFGYASFLSAFVSIALFAGPKLLDVAKTLLKRGKRQEKDKLNKIMESYQDVPLWYYGCLFLICFTTNMVLIFTQQLYIPWWAFIVALIFGAFTVVVSVLGIRLSQMIQKA
jgi:amino acid transporter